jgi:hypothetical protein
VAAPIARDVLDRALQTDGGTVSAQAA